jgi:hypothetical protein
MTRPEARAAFEGKTAPEPTGAEATFALSIVGMVVLGVVLTALAVLVAF